MDDPTHDSAEWIATHVPRVIFDACAMEVLGVLRSELTGPLSILSLYRREVDEELARLGDAARAGEDSLAAWARRHGETIAEVHATADRAQRVLMATYRPVERVRRAYEERERAGAAPVTDYGPMTTASLRAIVASALDVAGSLAAPAIPAALSEGTLVRTSPRALRVVLARLVETELRTAPAVTLTYREERGRAGLAIEVTAPAAPPPSDAWIERLALKRLARDAGDVGAGVDAYGRSTAFEFEMA